MDDRELWHVTLTVGGDAHPSRRCVARSSGCPRSARSCCPGVTPTSRAELQLLGRGRRLLRRCALALRLWGEHRRTAGLPAWSVQGLEVMSREEYIRRDHLLLAEPGSWQPF